MALLDGAMDALRADLPEGLVIEITERHRVTETEAFRAALEPWLAAGARIAIDDLGSGYASLEHVVELRPHFVKLAPSLGTGVTASPRRQSLVRMIKGFAEAVGTALIIEGIESREDLETLRDEGVVYGQGFLFARPGSTWGEAAPTVAPTPLPPVQPRADAAVHPALAARLGEAFTVRAAACAARR